MAKLNLEQLETRETPSSIGLPEIPSGIGITAAVTTAQFIAFEREIIAYDLLMAATKVDIHTGLLAELLTMHQ